MSTVILLSSSPPPFFAPSPTPVADSSSPFPSTAALIHGESPGRRRFKTKDAPRDGFTTTFATARQVLAEMSGAKNALILSPSKNRFRPSQDETIEDVKDNVEAEVKSKPIQPSAKCTSKPAISSQAMSLANPPSESITNKSGARTDCARNGQDSDEPLYLEKAVARKLDWTPSKQKPGMPNEKPIEYSAGFMNGLLKDFTYPDEKRPAVIPQHVQPINPAKRRRIEPARSGSTEAPCTTNVPKLTKSNSAPVKAAAKKNKSPAKKPLTITGLATSNYLGQEEVEETPLMQYLVSTQAQLTMDGADSVLETKIKKTRAAVSKLKGTGKKQTKSLLLSPKSAMKTYDELDAIFGSASQLAREESPTFLRETIEAMKESESFLMSDPILSPQLSVENTPHAGVARFRKTRNLWAAAGRDEDNALLHIDTIDLTDTPTVRAVFAGKDVMLQPGTRRAVSPNKTGVSLRGGCSPLAAGNSSTVLNIGNIDSPSINQARTFSTTANNPSPRRSPRSAPKVDGNVAAIVKEVSALPKEPPPPKPNYTGFSIHDLNKQIKSYGFKAMRKREKMIELLDRCWEEKYGLTEDVPVPAPTPTPEVVPFGDFLDKVHDISARPEPKVKKPRVRKKKAETAEAPEESAEKSVKKSRQRKKKEDEVVPPKPKVPRKRKSTKGVTVNGPILDIDAITETIPEELRALEAFDDWARPERVSKPKSQVQPANNTEAATQRPPTPPASLPPKPDAIPHNNQEVPDVIETNTTPNELGLVPTPTPSPASMASQITAAIMHQSNTSTPDRNHNTNPTWHEKILLYDPIILEDLASWLNTEGLGAISEDREVSALDVREWCESKGICCLWRGGWRGNKLAQ